MDEERKKCIAFLTGKHVNSPEVFFDELDSVGKDKLARLINGDIKSSKTTFQQEYKNFTDKVPAWSYVLGKDYFQESKKAKTTHDNETERSDCTEKDEVINLFWMQFNEEQNRKILVIRKQNSGLCYLHAPIVLEHYLIAISSVCTNASMIDIGLYEANLLDGNNLENFLLKDEGGGSKKTLQDICRLKVDELHNVCLPSPDSSIYVSSCDEILHKVADAPALVSCFTVYDEFLLPGKCSYDGVPIEDDNKKYDRHAMVLIGARKSADQKYFFLLQNWWENKYFVEVSGEYMSYCGGIVTFVKKAVYRTANFFETYQSDYAETSVDCPESSSER